MPAGLVQVRISPYSGAIASVDDPEAIFETFMADRLPQGGVLGGGEGADDGGMLAAPAGDGTSPADPGTSSGSEPLF
jgi:hypothetical protein